MRVCSKCGNKIKEDSFYCSRCGEKVRDIKFCRYCGKEISIDATFCKYCGARLRDPDKMEKLLMEKNKLREKLEFYKKGLENGILSQEEYQRRYDETIDELVDIEDKIIQEKMKGEKKK